jgi:hypothetical protein
MQEGVHTEKEILKVAHEAETDQHLSEAAHLYEELIKKHPLKAYAYDRLMIVYRKLKKYKDELRVVNRGIKAFEIFFKEKSEKLAIKHKQLMRLSNALMKSTGLKEKNHEYFPEPLNKWRRRKEVIEKKLKAA